ncbi:hypothetical protein DIPPA_11447 [Diplonema papillatum]|nr:hypothetical protein DIPPA_11447 [Diplonema papillatum]
MLADGVLVFPKIVVTLSEEGFIEAALAENHAGDSIAFEAEKSGISIEDGHIYEAVEQKQLASFSQTPARIRIDFAHINKHGKQLLQAFLRSLRFMTMDSTTPTKKVFVTAGDNTGEPNTCTVTVRVARSKKAQKAKR